MKKERGVCEVNKDSRVHESGLVVKGSYPN